MVSSLSKIRNPVLSNAISQVSKKENYLNRNIHLLASGRQPKSTKSSSTLGRTAFEVNKVTKRGFAWEIPVGLCMMGISPRAETEGGAIFIGTTGLGLTMYGLIDFDQWCKGEGEYAKKEDIKK